MSKPQKVEAEALEQAGVLLKFAAENKTLPKDAVATIAQAWEAYQADSWTPNMSAAFWPAYNALCAVVQPASLNSIRTNTDVIPRSAWWKFWELPGTRPKRVARRYLVTLSVALLVSIVLQFIVSNAANLSVEIDKLLSDMAQIEAKKAPDMDALRDIIGSEPFATAKLTPDQRKQLNDILLQIQAVWIMEDRVAKKLEIFSKLSSLGYIATSWQPGGLGFSRSMTEFDENQLKHYFNLRYFSSVLEPGLLVIKILNTTFLPLLLGFVGSCAYVTRLISDQIKDSTYSSTSGVRHLVRVGLGALAGVVVGFGWIGSAISLSPLALAFIAGYAIEPVFATVDGIAEKFRRP